ncbi:SMP-30/gluconolactonase/LRE family protein [Zobellia barbeyronii]|uniref:SMP-30/gluconolactonase/LRE family protein n=1 Tax=Zobellia barbeyronii TaxID=2748009 RepID=A0ABS5WJ68_9FLAO|nr:SMP-30/gluconolactonase/LRE family protein [Zobellia barbeyronii]MBT2163441.1 SMP-30/gluconolactonase/LRE family protein [Zobellia barbeyronii]
MKRNQLTFFLSALIILGLSSCKSQQNISKGIIAKDAKLTLVSDEYEFTEGPAVDKNGDIYFTDQPNDRIVKWDAATNTVSDYMKPSGRANGLYFDHDGNLLAAADEKNELWSIAPDKNVTVLIGNYEGKKLNGPNDLWVDLAGGIYFTDPFYKRSWWKHTEPEQTARRVYYLIKGNSIPRIVAEGFEQPNGIIGSADGKMLYISDIGAKKTFVYTVDANGNLSNKKLFTDMGSDGMTLDNLGNLYLTGKGVTVFNSKGEQIEHIDVPENWTANVTFGGPDQKTLFITAMDSAYTLEMNVNGVR